MKFVDENPAKPRGAVKRSWKKEVDELARNKGRWVLLHEGSSSQVSYAKDQIRELFPDLVKFRGTKASPNVYQLWGTYVGP